MKLAGGVRGRAERTIVWRVWERMLENEFIDRGVALAAKAFVSFFPVVIVVAAFAPPAVRAAIRRTLAQRSGMSGQSLAIFQSAFATSDSVRRATGVLGLVFAVYYVNSFTSALQRAYIRAWRRPRLGLVYSYALGAVWLAGVLAYFSLIGAMRAAFGGGPGFVFFGFLALAAAIGLWWVMPWVMLGRQVRLRVLLPTGVLTGLGMTVYGATSPLWMPVAVTQNQHQFGFFGVALALVTWLSGAAFIIVGSACAAPVLAEDHGALGRLIRGPNPALLIPGAVPSLGAPLRAPTLSTAIGLRHDPRPRPGRPPRPNRNRTPDPAPASFPPSRTASVSPAAQTRPTAAARGATAQPPSAVMPVRAAIG